MLVNIAGRVVIAGTLLILGSTELGSGQSPAPPPGQQSVEPSSQPAVDAIRELARTIGECPEAIDFESRWGKGQLEIIRWYIGPPNNVVWDVAPSNTVRSPYMGYIEFSTSHFMWVPPETVAKYDRAYPGLRMEAIIHATGWKFRYEFDVGPVGVELTRALSRMADAKEWKDPLKRNICWDNAARKGWAPGKK